MPLARFPFAPPRHFPPRQSQACSCACRGRACTQADALSAGSTVKWEYDCFARLPGLQDGTRSRLVYPSFSLRNKGWLKVSTRPMMDQPRAVRRDAVSSAAIRLVAIPATTTWGTPHAKSALRCLFAEFWPCRTRCACVAKCALASTANNGSCWNSLARLCPACSRSRFQAARPRWYGTTCSFGVTSRSPASSTTRRSPTAHAKSVGCRRRHLLGTTTG